MVCRSYLCAAYLLLRSKYIAAELSNCAVINLHRRSLFVLHISCCAANLVQQLIISAALNIAAQYLLCCSFNLLQNLILHCILDLHKLLCAAQISAAQILKCSIIDIIELHICCANIMQQYLIAAHLLRKYCAAELFS